MKKHIKLIVAVIITAALFFTLGNSSNAQYDWLNEVLNNAVEKVHGKGRVKTDELKTQLSSGLGELIKQKVEPEVTEMETRLETELDAYFQEKLNLVTETEGYQEVKASLTIIEQQAINLYKAELDKAFADALGQ